MKLLNLDDLIPTERFVRIKGVDYSIAEQSLGNLIGAIKIRLPSSSTCWTLPQR